MKKETIVIILLCVLLVAEAAALVFQNRRYNDLMAAYREAAARNSGQNRTIGGSVGNIVDTLINLFA